MLVFLKILAIFRILWVRWAKTLSESAFKNDFACSHSGNSEKTFYILGCGSSINHLSAREIEIINNADSVAINLFIMHDEIKPTLYSVEIADSGEYGKVKNSKIYCELLREKARTGGCLRFVIDSSNWTVINKMLPDILQYGQVNLVHQIPIPCRSIRYFGELHAFLMSSYVRRLLKPCMLYGKNASVISLVYFGLLRGYKNIVLCGVDLTSEYFWEADGHKHKYPGGQGIVNMHRASSIHKTDTTPLPVSQILKSINGSLSGSKIWVSSPLSRLSNDLPVYEFNDEF